MALPFRDMDQQHTPKAHEDYQQSEKEKPMQRIHIGTERFT
jgi:hypothetical protein